MTTEGTTLALELRSRPDVRLRGNALHTHEACSESTPTAEPGMGARILSVPSPLCFLFSALC